MTNIVAMAKVGTFDVERRINFLEAMENAKIDRTETCFKGFGFLHVDDLVEHMKAVDEMCEETPW